MGRAVERCDMRVGGSSGGRKAEVGRVQGAEGQEGEGEVRPKQ